MTMTNMASLTVNDGQIPPVSHTYSPVSNAGAGVARWQDREHYNGIAIGFTNLTFSVREPVKAGGPHRVKLDLSIPKLDTSTVVPTVVGVGRASVEFVLPGTFTQADRTDLRMYIANLLVSGSLGGNIQEMVMPY